MTNLTRGENYYVTENQYINSVDSQSTEKMALLIEKNDLNGDKFRLVTSWQQHLTQLLVIK